MSVAWEPTDELVEMIDSLCRGDIEPEQFTRLSDMITTDSSARSYYVRYLHMHAGLPRILQSSEASNEEHATETKRLENRRIGVGHPFGLDVSPPVSDFAGLETDNIVGANIESQFPLLSPLPSLSTTHSPLSTNFVGGLVFSYMVASVVLCMMLLSAWAYKITHHDNQIVNDPKSAPTSVDPRCELVAQITAMKDCRWAEQSAGDYLASGISLGRELNLAAGLLEITYKTGAKVILEGPCTYKVDSRTGGYLQQGKLTARVEKRGERREERWNKGVTSNQPRETAGGDVASKSLATSRQPLATNNSSLFTVTTPTAVITDLGTEFGVEVGGDGRCDIQVFQGVVEAVLLRDGNADGSPRRVTEGHIACVTAVSSGFELKVAETPVGFRKFVRQLPTPMVCRHQLGQVGEFKASGGDLINAGQPSLAKIELTSGEAVQSSSIDKLIDGDVYGEAWEGNTRATFTPSEGAVVTVSLDITAHPSGYDIMSIVSLTGSGGRSHGQERSSQKYDVAYSTVDDPDVFDFLPCGDSGLVERDAHGWPEMQVTLSGGKNVPIIREVAKLRFIFHNAAPADLESMYREIDVFGKPSDRRKGGGKTNNGS